MFSSLSSSALNRRDAVKYAAFSITSAFLLSSCGVGTQNPASSSSTSQAVVDEQSTRTVLENLADQLRSSIAPDQKALRGPNSAADTPEIQPMVDTPTPAFPVTFKDFNGTEVTVKSADRVLALDLYGTLAQQMIALGLGGRLVGRVTSSTEQSLAHLPLVTQNGHDLNAEAILATSPDLVLWDKSNGPIEIVDQLRAAGVTVVVFDHERRMDKIIPQRRHLVFRRRASRLLPACRRTWIMLCRCSRTSPRRVHSRCRSHSCTCAVPLACSLCSVRVRALMI